MSRCSAVIPLINGDTVNATATVTGNWFPAHAFEAATLYASHASSLGTGDVTYYVDLYFKAAKLAPTDSPAGTSYYRVTLGNIAADSTVSQFTPSAIGEIYTYIRGVAIGQALNPADTVAQLDLCTY